MTTVFIPAETRREAIKNAPVGYFAKIVKVCGGWQFFETIDEYNVWKNQK